MSDAPNVKVCGVTSLHDAELAGELGAWAVGMIFYEGSPRRCSTTEAQRIVAAMRRKMRLCGVFVNASLDRVVAAVEDLGLDLVQLHGDEGPAFCAEVARRSGVAVIKAAQVSGPGDIRDLERFHVDFHLLDARASAPERQQLRGGTGETFDWSLLATRRSQVPLILSGGLDADNVAAAIGQVRPFAVDTASGTEAAPGRKDPRLLRAFFDAVASTGAGRTPATVEDGPTRGQGGAAAEHVGPADSDAPAEQASLTGADGNAPATHAAPEGPASAAVGGGCA